MPLFKLVSLSSIRGGILVRKRTAQETSSEKRPALDIYNDYNQLKEDFDRFITENGLQIVEPAKFDSARKTTYAGFDSNLNIFTFKPDQQTVSRPKDISRFMSFSDFQKRDQEKWDQADLQATLQRAKDISLQNTLAAYESQIKNLLIELGLQNPEGAGKAHDRTTMRGVDLSAKDMAARLLGDLKRVEDAALKQLNNS
jgi:hypothetical protein